MKRSKRLQPVLHLAERNRKQAEIALGKTQQALLAEQEKLQQLEVYLKEYQQQSVTLGQAGIRIQQWQQMQAFVARLGTAIEKQKQQVGLYEKQQEQVREQWQSARGHSRAIESLVEKAQHTELLQEEKNLQKEVDELSQYRHRRPR